jgi:hypothetical protein
MCPHNTKSASRLLSRAPPLQLSHMRPLWHTCSNLGYCVTNLLCLPVLPALRTHRYADTYTAVSVCMRAPPHTLSICVYVYLHVFLLIHTHAHTYIYTYIPIYIYLYLYTYIYMPYTHTHTHRPTATRIDVYPYVSPHLRHAKHRHTAERRDTRQSVRLSLRQRVACRAPRTGR